MGGQAVGSSSAAPCGSACLPMPSWQARAAVDPRLRAEGDGGEEKGSLSIEWARHGKRCFCPSPLHQTVRQETPPFTPSSLFRTARHRRRCFSPSPLSCRENTRPFSPPHEPVPTIPPSRHGYTARRCSEAGSARGGRGRRRTSRTGPAENGLPPATRGKRSGVGPALSLHAPNGAPGVPVRHTRGQEMADASASSAGMDTVRKEAPSVRFAMERGADAKTERPVPETGEDHPRPLPLQRDRSRGQKPLNGALKGATYKQSVEAASSAPSDDAL